MLAFLPSTKKDPPQPPSTSLGAPPGMSPTALGGCPLPGRHGRERSECCVPGLVCRGAGAVSSHLSLSQGWTPSLELLDFRVTMWLRSQDRLGLPVWVHAREIGACRGVVPKGSPKWGRVGGSRCLCRSGTWLGLLSPVSASPGLAALWDGGGRCAGICTPGASGCCGRIAQYFRQPKGVRGTE